MHRRVLLIRACAALLFAFLRVRCVPFRRLAARMGRTGRESGFELSDRDRALVGDIEWAIDAASRRMLPRPTCLMQAAAAKSMCDRAGVPATVYLGVAPGMDDGRQINAHAWLRCGDRIVTGKVEAVRYRPLASFS